jgi:hypothetical protein
MSMQAELGSNRTGIATAPELSQRMLEGTMEFPPSSPGDEQEIARVREAYVKESEPLGSVPPPADVAGMVKTAIKGLRGTKPTQFIDKLGERLAFERSGVRLYEAVLSKLSSTDGVDNGPQRSELERIMLEEYEHFKMLVSAVTRLGGDPTVMTPSADLHATMTKGILEVAVDPRTNLAQCLEALLVVELADNECWDALVEMAQTQGEDELVSSFTRAREEEDEHLLRVRAWVAAAQDRLPR